MMERQVYLYCYIIHIYFESSRKDQFNHQKRILKTPNNHHQSQLIIKCIMHTPQYLHNHKPYNRHHILNSLSLILHLSNRIHKHKQRSQRKSIKESSHQNINQINLPILKRYILLIPSSQIIYRYMPYPLSLQSCHKHNPSHYKLHLSHSYIPHLSSQSM
jgi:hypothetical protein